MAVLASLRIANQATLLEQLLGRKAASRAELAKATGMSKPTVGKIIDDLVRAGVVEEMSIGDGGRPGLGRPGKQLRLATTRNRFVVMELGVEWTRISALPPSPPEQERWEVQFKTPTSDEAWQEKVVHGAEKPGRQAARGRCWSARRASSTRSAGRVLLSPNLHWSEHADLPWMLRQIWSAPVGLVQEVRAMALGELGARPDARRLHGWSTSPTASAAR